MLEYERALVRDSEDKACDRPREAARTNIDKVGADKGKRIRTASRNPRSRILFVVCSTLPVRKRSKRMLSLYDRTSRKRVMTLF